jgi:hypothetical protein
MKGITNKINKKFILESISQVSIFSKYLDISETIILDCIENNNLIISPIRPINNEDSDPSCGFKFNNKGQLKMRDFGGYFWGDCFDLVCLILNKVNNSNLSVSNPFDFTFILNHIATQFNILSGIPDNIVTIRENLHKVKSATKVFEFEIRDWDRYDKSIWIDKYKKLLTFDDLNNAFVYPVEQFWVDKLSQPNPKYYYSKTNPCYAYYQGTYGGVNLIRFYFPKRSNILDNITQPKFISNSQVIQGLINFNCVYDYIIVTKSYKDVIVIKKLLELSIFSLKGTLIGVIALPSENYYMSDKVINFLLDHLKCKDPCNIIMLLDFDAIGRKTVFYTINTFSVRYMFLTNGIFGLPNYGAKDPSDFVEYYGIDASLTIINNLYEKITDTN